MVAILPTSSSHRRLCASDIWHLAGWRASQVSIYQHLARGKWLGKYTWSWLKYVEHVGSGSSNFMINIDVSLLWGKHGQRKSCFIGCLAARIVTFSKKKQMAIHVLPLYCCLPFMMICCLSMSHLEPPEIDVPSLCCSCTTWELGGVTKNAGHQWNLMDM